MVGIRYILKCKQDQETPYSPLLVFLVWQSKFSDSVFFFPLMLASFPPLAQSSLVHTLKSQSLLPLQGAVSQDARQASNTTQPCWCAKAAKAKPHDRPASALAGVVHSLPRHPKEKT
eukprot:764819-Hanusia_phi.AAC.1